MSTFQVLRRGAGPGPYPDVTKIPTPPLQATAVAITFVLPAVATIAFGLRMYVRISNRTHGLDDYLAGAALVSAILVSATLFMFLKLNYYGWEDDKVPDFNPSAGLWFNFFEQLVYNPTLAFVKASILVFLLRLGAGFARSTSIVIWTLMSVNIGHAIAVFFAALFQCVPIESNWHPELRENATCIDDSFHIIQSAITIITDICVLAVPFWVFLRLRMARANKIAVLGIFATATLVPIIAIIRLVNIYNLLILGQKTRHHNIAYVWTAVEVNLAVTCCCLPALRPLFTRWFPSMFSDFSSHMSTPEAGTLATIGGSGAKKKKNSKRGDEGEDEQALARTYTLNHLHPYRKKMTSHSEARGSPEGSEDDIITYDGILMTTKFEVGFHEGQESKRKQSDERSAHPNEMT